MQIAVSYDDNGRIMVMFDPSKLKSDKGTIGYKPAQGENHRVLTVPQGLEGKSMRELASTLRVNAKGASPTLEARG